MPYMIFGAIGFSLFFFPGALLCKLFGWNVTYLTLPSLIFAMIFTWNCCHTEWQSEKGVKKLTAYFKSGFQGLFAILIFIGLFGLVAWIFDGCN